jgi:hypothetical protein
MGFPRFFLQKYSVAFFAHYLNLISLIMADSVVFFYGCDLWSLFLIILKSK